VSDLPLQAKFDHAAVVVSDLDRSVEFYTRFFGGEVELIKGVQGAEMAELHGLEENAHFDLAFIRHGEAMVELFQFHEPLPAAGLRPPAANEPGASHIAFEVDDVEAAYERLTAEGVEFSRPPYRVSEGDAEGFVLSFFFDPDGNKVELIAPVHPPAVPKPSVIVSLELSDEGRERFLELIAAVEKATKAETGAEEWTLLQGAENPNSFVIYERYADAAALETHHHQPALKALLAELKPLLAAPPQMTDLQTFPTT
jgi:quinol monooxygenase YgiN/catechol 2,3-dioxygenase-like lactoylglutathione lyase family enzyme